MRFFMVNLPSDTGKWITVASKTQNGRATLGLRHLGDKVRVTPSSNQTPPDELWLRAWETDMGGNTVIRHWNLQWQALHLIPLTYITFLRGCV